MLGDCLAAYYTHSLCDPDVAAIVTAAEAESLRANDGASYLTRYRWGSEEGDPRTSLVSRVKPIKRVTPLSRVKSITHQSGQSIKGKGNKSGNATRA